MKHNPIFKIIQLGFQFALCAMAFSFGSAHAQEYYLFKSWVDKSMCLQDNDLDLKIEKCDPLNEKQKWRISKEPRGITTDVTAVEVYMSKGVSDNLPIPLEQQGNCLGLFQEKKESGSRVVFQDCRTWLGHYKSHNLWVKQKIDAQALNIKPEPLPVLTSNNFICFSSDYKSKFADSQSLDKIENTIGGKYTNNHPGGISGSFFLTGRFCTNAQRWMAGDLIFVKIPANTISCAGQEGGRPKNCQDYRNSKNYILVKAKTDFPNGGGWIVEPHPAVRSFFTQENGKYKYIEDKNVVDYLTQDLFTLIQIKAASQGGENLLEAPINNPPNKVLEIYIEVRNHPNKNFSLGSARLVDFVPLPAMSASEVTAKCGDKDIRGAIGIGSGNDITTRFQGDFRCSVNEKFTLRSSPFVRAKVGHDFASNNKIPGYRHGFAVCKGDAFTDDLHLESIINEPNTQTFKIPRSQPINSLYQWTLGDTRQASKIGKGSTEPPPCQFIRGAVRLPDGSFECVNCSVPFYSETNLIWAFQLYDHPSTPNVAPDPIINWHYMQLVGGFFVRDSSKSQPSPPPAAPPNLAPIPTPSPPSTPLPTPPPQSSTEPLVKETPLVSRALKPELGVRQPWLRPRYGNLESYRNQGTWTKDIGAGYERHDWDTPAFINLRKVDDKALFANHPKRLDYYPDGVIPVINFETDLTYRIDLAEIHKQIKERGYSETETTQIIGKLGPNYRGCSISAVHFLNGGRSTHLGTVPLAPQLKMSSPYIEGNYLFDNNPLTDRLISLNVSPQQGIEFVSRIECKIEGIKKGNTTENFLYISKERSFIWQSNPYVILLSSKNEGDENSLFTFDSSFLMETEKGKWGINGGLKTPPMNNPFKADLDKTSLCVDNKCGNVVKTYFSPDNEAIFSSINLRARLKRLLSPRERYSSFDKEINSVLNDEELAFSYGFFFTTEVNYGVGDVLAYPDGEKTESVPRAFGPVWAAPNSKRAKNYLRQLRPNIDPKILEARWLERQKYLRSNNFDNQSISRSLAYCNWEKNGERGFNARARYGFPADPKGILSDLANDLEGKCTWLDKPLPSEIVKTNPPPDVLPPPASACNQQLAPTCASNPRFSKIRFGAYYFRDAATSARVEPFNIYLRENSTYVIGEREDLPSVSGNYFICGDKIHFQNFSKIGTFTSQNQLQIESFLPGLAGIQKVFLCSGNACRTEGEVPVASKLCQPKFIQISPPPPVKPEPLPEQEKKPELQPITPPQVGEQPRKPLPEIITPIQIPPPPPPTSVPGDTGGFRQSPPGAISAPVPIPPPAIIPPPPSSVPRDTGFGQSRPVPISPPTIVPPPPVQPAPQPVAKPTPPQPDNKPVPVKKPEPVVAPQPKPTVPPAKKEPEFSVPIAR